MSSIRSSSGVSSTSSLSHYNSDIETPREVVESGLGFSKGSRSPSPGGSTTPTTTQRTSTTLLPDVLIAVSEPDAGESCSRNKVQQSSHAQSNVSNSSSSNQRRLVAVKSVSTLEGERISNLPSEDEEFDYLAYQRATGSIKIRRRQVQELQQGQSKSFSYENETKLSGNSTSPSKERGGNGSKKPKDLLNLLLTDGSLESSYV